MTGAYPDVTLAVLNFNRKKSVLRALRSCLNQFAPGLSIEVLLVDDRSTDGSVACVARELPELRVIALPENLGVGYASKAAVMASTAKFFMRVDSDDFISQITVAVLAGVLSHDPTLSYAYGDIIVAQDGSGEVGETPAERTTRLTSARLLYNHGAGVMFRREAILQCGNYRADLRNFEDLDLFLRLDAQGAKGFRVPMPLYRYTMTQGSLSSRKHSSDEMRIWGQYAE